MNLLVFGYGYTAQACVQKLRPRLERLALTARSTEKITRLRADGLAAFRFDGRDYDPQLIEEIAVATKIIVSTPPSVEGDPVLKVFQSELSAAKNLSHLLYLSTIGVYGNFEGAWVDEATPPKAQSERAICRLKAEKEWLDFGIKNSVNIQILRLAGIYGRGRNALCDLENGTARRLFKQDQVFNRIHVEDIALVAEAAFNRGTAGSLYNVTDNEPGPPQDVVAYAARLLGVAPPPLLKYEEAELSEMARAFYSENKRVANVKIREALGVTLHYPTYREGLSGLLAAGEGKNGAPSRRQKDQGQTIKTQSDL